MNIANEQATAAMGSILQQQEHEIYAALYAIENRLWGLDEVKRRCQIIRHINDPEGCETLSIDGTPMVVFYPITSSLEVRDDKYVLTINRPFRRLYAATKREGSTK